MDAQCFDRFARQRDRFHGGFMKRFLILAAIIFGCAIPAHAAGGACPTAAQYVNPANVTGPLVTLSSIGVTSCFYVADSGADTNSGTTEAAPFLHAPFMPNCASSCATAQSAFAAGEGIIFRGGDTWHYFSGTPLIGLPSGWPTGTNGYAWRPTVSGTSSNPVYIGVDQTWFTGASWTRPIITNDNPSFKPPSPVFTDGLSTSVSSCTFPQGNLDDVAIIGPTFYIFDNFEFTGMCFNDVNSNSSQSGLNEHNYIKQNQGGGTGSSPRWFFNNYFHGWSHTPFACPGISTSAVDVGGTGFTSAQIGQTVIGTGSNGSGENVQPQIGITGVSGGAVTSYTILYPGTDMPGAPFPFNMATAPGGSNPITAGTGFIISVTATSFTVCGSPGAFYGSTQQSNTGAVFAFNVFDGSDSDDLSFEGIQNDGYDVEENVFRHFAGTQILNNCHAIHDNLFEFINNGNDGAAHTDLWFCESETASTSNFFYNNLVRNIATEYNQQGLSAYFWLNPAAGITDYFFNNVEHDAAFGADQNNLGQPGCCGTGSQVLIYNNTIEVVPVSGNPNFAAFGVDSHLGSVTSQNNHYITNSTVSTNCGKMFTVTTTVNGGNTSCSGDVFQTISAANSSGSTSANDYAITSSSPAFEAGANETSLCPAFGTAFCGTTSAGVSYNATTHIVTFPNLAPVLRPASGGCPGSGCWNAGAFSGESTTPPPLAFVQDTATKTGGGAGPYTITYTTANNTAGNTSCVGLTFYVAIGTAAVSSLTSSAGNTYTAVPGSLVTVAATHYANIYAQWWCATGIVGSVKDKLTINFSASVGLRMELIEIGPGGVLDQTAATSGATTAISAGSVTTPSNGAFGITAVFSDDGFGFGPGWFTPGSGWTVASLNSGGGSSESGAQYQAQATAGSITGDLTSIHGTPNHWVASMITIRTH